MVVSFAAADASLALADTFWASFVPRADRPELFDQQQSFVESQDAVAFLIAGNASGKTEAAAYKCANLLLHERPPPRPNTPFWVIAKSYYQVCSVCWGEKLHGHQHIPDCEVEWDRVSWYDKKMGWPLRVPLKPWPGTNNNWLLEFKSYEQGREEMQGRSLGGFWFSEQFPATLFIEVLRGCRDYMYPGAQFCEFTPIDPEMCIWVEKLMDDPPRGFAFYRANSECNKENLADGWFEQFFGSVPDEMQATRMTGALAVYEGIIYQSFNPAVHCVGDEMMPVDPRTGQCGPPSVLHFRGIDWGASVEHPFVCVWGYRDGLGDWYVYDEYWCNDQRKIIWDHADEIKVRWPWPEQSPNHRNTYADPSAKALLNVFSKLGIQCHGAYNDVDKGIDCVRSLLKVNPATGRPRLFIHKRRCPHLIEEMRKYRWMRGRDPAVGHYLNPKVGPQKPLKRNDDSCDALRYMVYSCENAFGAVPGSMRYKEQDNFRRSVQLASGMPTQRIGARVQVERPNGHRRR